MDALLCLAEGFVLLYFASLNAAFVGFLLAAFFALRRSRRRRAYEDLRDVARSPLAPSVSVLVWARGAPEQAAASVAELLRLDYPRFEVVAVVDAPDGGALEALKAAFKLAPEPPEAGGVLPTRRVRAAYRSRSHDNLLVLEKDGGGRADAWNAALNAAQHPYFISVDSGDTLEPDALLRLVREVLESPVRLIGVGGAVRAANGCPREKGRIVRVALGANPLAVFQAVESFRAGTVPGVAFSGSNGLLSLAGSRALFERDAAASMGGWRGDGEDLEFVTRLHRHLREGGERGYAVAFVPEPVCWAAVPATLTELARERRDRQSALLGMLARNKELLFDARFGGLGSFSYPFTLVYEGWGPLLECLGWGLLLAALLRGSAGFAAAFLSLAAVGGAALALGGVLLGEVAFRRYQSAGALAALAASAVLEGVCFRPLTAGLRALGVVDHLRRPSVGPRVPAGAGA